MLGRFEAGESHTLSRFEAFVADAGRVSAHITNADFVGTFSSFAFHQQVGGAKLFRRINKEVLLVLRIPATGL
jgi:hypothetical protein